MAGWTKADFDANYSFPFDKYLPDGWNEQRDGPLVRAHYSYHFMAPFFAQWWGNIAPAVGLTATDRVVVVGSAFGWGVEALINEVPGITAIGVDISDYVQTEKGNSEEAEFIAEMQAIGKDEDSPRGLEIRALARAQRTPNSIQIEQEDLLSNQSRNRIRQALGNQWPTHIITEDLIQTLDDAELTAWVDAASNIPATVVHAVSGTVSKWGYADIQAIADRTGHMVVHMGMGTVANP